MPALLVDAGVLIAAGRNDTKAWAYKKQARDQRTPIVVTTPVLAQAWRSARDVNLARFLKGRHVEPLSDPDDIRVVAVLVTGVAVVEL